MEDDNRSAAGHQPNGMTDDELVDLADEYIGAGIPVFVIQLTQLPTKTEKRPTTRNGHDDATLELTELADQIISARTRLPGAVLGIGAVPGAAGYVAVDYDVKNGAKGGEMLERHRATYGEDVDRVSYSSISGAINVLMRKADPSIVIGNTSPWADVDIRADNGWIVPPGVTTPWGSWEWRSGDLEDLVDNVMPAAMAAKLVESVDIDSSPVSVAAVQEWLNAGKGPDDEFTQGELRKWLRTIATCGNRNPTLFEALSWLRRLDPAHVDRRAAYSSICEVWRQRMAKDGEKGRNGEPESMLRRVVGFAQAQEHIDAEAEATERIESSYWMTDVDEWLAGDREVITPALLTMNEGDEETESRSLLYIDRYNEIHGDSGTGKSWAEAYCVRELMRAGRNVMVIDLEDNLGPLLQRLRQISVPDALISRHLKFVHPGEEFGPIAVSVLIEQIVDHDVAHLFIDSLGEAFAVSGVSENNDDEVGPWIRNVVRHIIDETGCGVTALDHIIKAADNPLHPSGSKRKRAAITGSSWYVIAIDPFDKDAGGRVRFRCGKDRHGTYKRGQDVADMVMTFIGPMCELELWPVVVDEEALSEKERNTVESAVIACEKYRGGSPSRNALMKAMKDAGAKASTDDLRGAIDIAVLRGFLAETAGANRSKLYTFVSEYTGEMAYQEWKDRG